MGKTEKRLRWAGVLVCEMMAVATIVYLLLTQNYKRLPLALATTAIILVPCIVERLFDCKICLPAFLICLFYTVGPMFGQCHNFYYTISWWDRMLHLLGGVLFAFFGLFLFEKYVGKERKKAVMTAIFALCFSMAVSVFWEFAEYCADSFFGADMQDDVVVDRIHSYLLDDEVGNAGTIEEIEEVLVNGKPLPVKGYIDIGLNDTMLDMLLETAGAAIAVILYLLTRGEFMVFLPSEGKYKVGNTA